MRFEHSRKYPKVEECIRNYSNFLNKFQDLDIVENFPKHKKLEQGPRKCTPKQKILKSYSKVNKCRTNSKTPVEFRKNPNTPENVRMNPMTFE